MFLYVCRYMRQQYMYYVFACGVCLDAVAIVLEKRRLYVIYFAYATYPFFYIYLFLHVYDGCVYLHKHLNIHGAARWSVYISVEAIIIHVKMQIHIYAQVRHAYTIYIIHTQFIYMNMIHEFHLMVMCTVYRIRYICHATQYNSHITCCCANEKHEITRGISSQINIHTYECFVDIHTHTFHAYSCFSRPNLHVK